MKNVIYLLVDALSYDNIGKREFRNSPTPFLDALIEKSFSCEEMYTQAPYTEAAFVASLAGEETLEHGGYMLGMQNCPRSYGEIFSSYGYSTLSTLSPYVSSKTYVKEIEQYFYSRLFSINPLKIYRLSYFKQLKEQGKLSCEHIIVCRNLVQDAFEIWIDQVESLMAETDKTKMVEKYVDRANLVNMKTNIEKEYEQYKSDENKYILEILSDWEEHPFLKIDFMSVLDKHSQDIQTYLETIWMETLEVAEKKYQNLMEKNQKIDYKYLLDLALYDDSDNFYGCRHAYKGYANLYKSTILTDTIKKHYDREKITVSAKTQLDFFSEKILAYDQSNKNYFAFIHIEDFHLPSLYYTYDTEECCVLDEELKYHKSYLKNIPQNYRGNITADLSAYYVDYYIGKFFEKIRENTKNDFLFIVTADHGFPSNYNPPRPLIYNSFYNENYHIPFVMYDSSKKCKEIDSHRHHSKDIFDYVINNALEDNNQAMKQRDYILIEYPGPGCPDISRNKIYYSIFDTKYKICAKARLSENINAQTITMIYNIETDPEEKKNLVKKAYENKEVQRLIALLQERHVYLREKFADEKFWTHIVGENNETNYKKSI